MKRAGLASALVLAAGIAVAAAITSLGQADPWNPKADVPPKREGSLEQRYAKLPLAFEPNRGQAVRGIAFLARGAGYSIAVRPREALLSLGDRGALRMQIAGGSQQARLVSHELLPGKVNYLLGDDRSKWLTNVPTFARLQAKNVYPGIDLAYHGRQGRLRYDFLVRPGASPKTIALDFAGARSLRLDRKGNLVLHLSGGSTVRQLAPRLYQEIGGERRPVSGRFLLEGKRVRFAVGAYDTRRTLVIDPTTLAYSTYLGGSGGDSGYEIAVDGSGAAYVTGYTDSGDFPTTSGAHDTLYGGTGDAFVSKLDATGATLVYSTYLGGNAAEFGYGIALDGSSAAYVTGYTDSSNFPTTSGAHDTTYGGLSDAFVSKLDATGATLVYSTYLGGSALDYGYAIGLDGSGTAYVTGVTQSSDFPTTSGAHDTTYGGSFDAFVSRLAVTGAPLAYSTYLGGGGTEFGRGIAVDTSGAAHVTGETSSSDFPTTSGAHDSTLGGVRDAFVTKLDAAGATLTYSTYLGGANDEVGEAIARDGSGSAYVTGFTESSDFPTTSGAYDTTYSFGLPDAFVSKLDASGAPLTYSTYLGGGGDDRGLAIAVDTSGAAYVTGVTQSSDFPTTSGAYDTTYGGSRDAFVTKLDPSGATLGSSTYLGGGSDEYGRGIALDTSGSAYVAGETRSSTFPTTSGAHDTGLGGSYDAFVSKFGTPTAVAVRSFAASRSGRGVLLRWHTGAEHGLLGFSLYRGQARLNRALIPARVGASSYSYLDRGAPRGLALRYRLQLVQRDGSRRWAGTLRVAPLRVGG